MNGLCVVRGGGDLATGVVWRLRRSGVPVVVTELAHPRAIRRTVALSTAIDNGSVVVEGLEAVHAVTTDDIAGISATGRIPVVIDPDLTQVRAASPIARWSMLGWRNMRAIRRSKWPTSWLHSVLASPRGMIAMR